MILLTIALAAQFAVAPASHSKWLGAPPSSLVLSDMSMQGDVHLPLVTFVVPGRRDVPVMLPESAVQSDMRGTFVYILDDKDRVVRRDVETGEAGVRGVAIVRGLDGDERVVDVAAAFLNPGEAVRPERARPARPHNRRPRTGRCDGRR